MNPSKAFILVSNKKIWPSHEKVKKNLSLAYLNAKTKDLSVSKLTIKSDLDLKEKLLKIIAIQKSSESIVHLVLLDIGINLKLFGHLTPFLDRRQFHIHLHIHGDVYFRYGEWIELLNKLEGHKLTLRVCSKAMQKFCKALFPQHTIQVIPFPIEDHFFKSHPKKSSKKVIAYFGRITADKGVLDLIQWWRSSKLPYQLHLYGLWDESTHLSWDDPTTFEQNSQQLQKLILQHPNISVKHLKSERSLLKAMDECTLAISLSRFKCEEYGLALREALARGKPVIASHWGGHIDLGKLSQVKLLKVKDDLSLDLKFSLEKTLQVLQKRKSLTKNEFSVRSISKVLSLSWGKAKKSSRVPKFELSIDELLKKSFK